MIYRIQDYEPMGTGLNIGSHGRWYINLGGACFGRYAERMQGGAIKHGWIFFRGGKFAWWIYRQLYRLNPN